jgi:Flp pilus assembly pilin Flp
MYRVDPNERLARRTQQFGQGMTEYIIILAFVAIACVGAYGSLGTTVREQTAAVADGLAGINAPAVQAVPAGTQQGNAASQPPAAPAIAALSSAGSGQNASQAAAVPYMAALSNVGLGQNGAPPAVAQLAMVAQPLGQGLIGGTSDSETPYIAAVPGDGDGQTAGSPPKVTAETCGESQGGSGSGADAPCDPPPDSGSKCTSNDSDCMNAGPTLGNLTMIGLGLIVVILTL